MRLSPYEYTIPLYSNRTHPFMMRLLTDALLHSAARAYFEGFSAIAPHGNPTLIGNWTTLLLNPH